MGALTPWEISWYAIAFMVTYVAIRLFFVAPYRLWREGQAEIAGLKEDLARPERAGSEELQRLRARKLLDLASEIHTMGWLCYTSAPGAGDKLDECHDRIMKLLGEANPGQTFALALYTYQNEVGKFLGPGRDQAMASKRGGPLSAAMIDFLHGKASEAELKRVLKELSSGQPAAQ